MDDEQGKLERLEKLEKIINEFTRQEIGNRVSEFSMIGLKLVLINELFKKSNENVNER